ncbi:ABC transporter permease subunit [Devosia ginsengisoli]|uniref:ABC transporter permease subunit n=1 Tax=Devosia ginsengisoli TaxID=400770 RepID=UPI0026EF220C|nr:ABC transporter permease subunit [Devosia ginsengisoli]MCR6669925.1 ABC transporter permease subunit [Devosia ginsengisoli]
MPHRSCRRGPRAICLGIAIGGISGFFGGQVDTFIQRLIKFLRLHSTIPLWMGLAAIPLSLARLPDLFHHHAYPVSLLGWYRDWRGQLREQFLSIANEDFVTAARLDGMSEIGIIFNHLVPSFMSHIIATLTLAIPTMILAETALSFLGIGLQPPIVSWGTLLQEAQNIRAVLAGPVAAADACRRHRHLDPEPHLPRRRIARCRRPI